MRASIFINYKIHKGKFSTGEKLEEASFDTDQSSFIKEAEPLIENLKQFVKNARLMKR
jgi:hypothetical protein